MQINTCPVCGQTESNPFLSCKDYTVSKEIFNICECKNCNFKYTNPIPNPEVLGNYYQSEEYISHSDTDKGLVSKLYKIVRNYTIKQKLSFIKSYVSRGTILDYGCGTGAFLSACKQDNWNAFGIEPDAGARTIASKKLENLFDSKESLFSSQPEIKYDIITLWHVLEHVVDLKNTVSLLTKHLTENGVIIIAVPNYKSYDAAFYKEFWAAYDLPRHLYHFEEFSVSKLMGEFGFKLKQTKPMLFDSFYVSLLSEKYQHGKSNLIKAFFVGFLSNAKAFFTKQYSSRVYVFKRA